MSNNITIAIAGNPNSGKTTLFNALTGSRQHVGNYPGVTVEKKEGKCKYEDTEIKVIDLPGTYSLSPYSIEEIVTRNFIIDEKPDVIVDVIDASNLERNLYLALQFLELEIPLLLVFNMMDFATSQGYKINIKLIEKLLDIPVVTAIASKGEGIEYVIKSALSLAKNKKKARGNMIKYSKEIDKYINILSNFLSSNNVTEGRYSGRWLAIKLLEKDMEIIEEIKKHKLSEEIMAKVSEAREDIKKFFNEEPENIISDRRYGFINGLYKETVRRTKEDKISTSEKIDSVLTHRFLGIPIFLLFMWLVFQMTFTLGTPPMELIEFLVDSLGNFIILHMNEGIFRSLIVDGIIGGVGGVIIFLPNIVLLFLAIAILEDTGYMARVAFIVDKLMHSIGLHGKSFIPMLIGFGCSVPAIMATRTLESNKDRLTTILIIPLMSCGARLPVYTLLISAFFSPSMAGNVLFSIYLTGFILAVIMAKIFRALLFPGESSPFVMELPPYRVPTLKSVLIHMWEHAYIYLQKAGTILLAISILMWFLTNFPATGSVTGGEKLASSYAGQIGKGMEPLIKPLGFDWKIGVALFSGFAAKEVIISTLGTIYNLEDIDDSAVPLRELLKNDKHFSPLVAYTLMIFILIYVPCMATIVVVWKETNSLYWPLFMIVYTIILAWIMSFITYQGGRLLL
ncbi:MAG: ferrous iron transport protein B [Candidatus Eremiobacterota bacterium]